MNNVQQPAERVIASVERVIVGKHVEVRMALVALLFVPEDARAAKGPLEWTQIQALVNEQKFQEALDETLIRLEVAKKRGDEHGWTRGLVWATQLRTGLHGYENSVRFLMEQPWPKDDPVEARLLARWVAFLFVAMMGMVTLIYLSAAAFAM